MLLQTYSDLPISFTLISAAATTINIPNFSASILPITIMDHSNHGITQQSGSPISTVTQALESARDTPEGAQDPTVVRILEAAVTDIWRKIEAQPASYVMTRDEFAVFNYFQGRFTGQEFATAARKRYWDHLQLTDGT